MGDESEAEDVVQLHPEDEFSCQEGEEHPGGHAEALLPEEEHHLVAEHVP